MFHFISKAVENIQKLADEVLELPADEEHDQDPDHDETVSAVEDKQDPPPPHVEEISPVPKTAEIEVQCGPETADVEVQTAEVDELAGTSNEVQDSVKLLQKYIQLIMENQAEFNENPCAFAAKKGDLGFLIWLKHYGFTCDKQVYYDAIKSQNQEIIQWCYAYNFDADENEIIDLNAKYSSNYIYLPSSMSGYVNSYHGIPDVTNRNNDMYSFPHAERDRAHAGCRRIVNSLFNKAVEYGNVKLVKFLASNYRNVIPAASQCQCIDGYNLRIIPVNWDDYVQRNKKQ